MELTLLLSFKLTKLGEYWFKLLLSSWIFELSEIKLLSVAVWFASAAQTEDSDNNEIIVIIKIKYAFFGFLIFSPPFNLFQEV